MNGSKTAADNSYVQVPSVILWKTSGIQPRCAAALRRRASDPRASCRSRCSGRFAWRTDRPAGPTRRSAVHGLRPRLRGPTRGDRTCTRRVRRDHAPRRSASRTDMRTRADRLRVQRVGPVVGDLRERDVAVERHEVGVVRGVPPISCPAPRARRRRPTSATPANCRRSRSRCRTSPPGRGPRAAVRFDVVGRSVVERQRDERPAPPHRPAALQQLLHRCEVRRPGELVVPLEQPAADRPQPIRCRRRTSAIAARRRRRRARERPMPPEVPGCRRDR